MYITRKTAATHLLSEYREEVYRLIAEIDAATDRDSLLVEERIKNLKQVLDDTDRRITAYMRELQYSRNSEATYASLGRGIRAALDTRMTPNESKPLNQTDVELPVIAPAETETVKKNPAAKVRSSKKRQIVETEGNDQSGKIAPKKTRIKVQIAELSAQGLSPGEIASRLGISIAEVDLALNLLHRSTGTL